MAGVRLIDLNPNIGTDSDSENWTQTHRDVVNRYVKSTDVYHTTMCMIHIRGKERASSLHIM